MPAGRPRKELEETQIQKMMSIQCTAQEVCGIYGIDARTLDARIKEWGYKNYSDMYRVFSADGKVSLRRQQFKTAVGDEPVFNDKGKMIKRHVPPSVQMLIHLGKHWLGQTDDHVDDSGDNEFVEAKSLDRGLIQSETD